MKMINAGNAAITDWQKYNRNCSVGQCRHKYLAPVPLLADVELFINFGTTQPTEPEWRIIDLCSPSKNSLLLVSSFIIAFNGRYWYGVFKGFTTTASYSSFIIAAYTGSQTFFSEQYQLETECETLTKLSVCYPYNYNGDDTNGIYIGTPDSAQPILGNPSLFYHHDFWTRQGEIVETQNKITFTSNPYRNFATTLNKSFEFRPELVPGWYKDYLLSVYFRGNITINGTSSIVTDLAFEDVDVDFWKAYAVLGKQVKGGFGCTPFVCDDGSGGGGTCVAPTVIPTSFHNAIPDQLYQKIVYVNGTLPIHLANVVKPAWMLSPVVSGSTVTFSGTPSESDLEVTSEVSFDVNNECSESIGSFAGTVYVSNPAVNVTGMITHGVRSIRAALNTHVPFDVTFPISGTYEDDEEVLHSFTGDVTVLSGASSGTTYNVVDGHISCITPSYSGGNEFIYSTVNVDDGIAYYFTLTIENPC